ncbi:MAG: magnesium/cobalt transporter CorA [Planctomycetes bacterium]|nr:magnesium/cobalt transporter CorA [Planctomycetota bacterium]
MISIYRWDCHSNCGGWQGDSPLPDGGAASLADGEIWWIDLENPTEAEEAAVFGKFLPIHPLTLEDITKPRREPDRGPHLPKVEEFSDYLFVIINPLCAELTLGAGKRESQGISRCSTSTQLSAVLAKRVLITHHFESSTAVTEVKQFLTRHTGLAARGPDYLFHLVLDASVDEYSPVVDRLSDRLDTIESRMFRRPPDGLLARLLKLKRRIVSLRKTLILEREVLMRLTRGEFELVDEREIAYYRNVYDHLVRYTELVEAAREMVSDLLQSYMAALSNRLNGIMKVLAMISTVVLPMSLIAGIYGMNFKVLPELEWTWGYPFALGLMLTTAIVSLAIFRWRKWF